MKATSAIFALLAASVGCGGGDTRASSDSRRAVPVFTARAERRDIEETLSLTGTLRPRAQVSVIAEVPARLLRIVHDEGASVAAGAVLAELDDTDHRLAFERAEAAKALAEANRAHAAVEKERADHLLSTNGITDKDHLAAQVGLQVAEAALRQAHAEAAIAAQQLARCRLRAPFAGRVARRLADTGAFLAQGTPVFVLVDDSVLEFRGPLPSADFGRARLGASVDVAIEALPGVEARGKVSRITPLVDDRTRSFEMVSELRGRKELVGGLFARARVHVGTVAGAVVVPPTALVRDGSRPDAAEVFVVKAGVVERRVVVLGIEQADAVQVREGLDEGEEVVLDPPAALGAGAAVAVQARHAG